MRISSAIFDAHAHMAADSPAGLGLLEQLGVRVLNISLGLDTTGAWRARTDFGADAFRELGRAHPKQFAWCTSFDLPEQAEPHYAERVIAALERDFADGACSCKVWKNVGMEVRDAAGKLMLIDHPLLEPVFAYLERRGAPVILHVGEPLACWQALDPKSPHYDYYREHPEWHMYGKSGMPSWAVLLGARDRLLARHPQLRVIGAHFGSIEHDVGELAKRLARFPNFAVDSGGRLLDVALQDRERVRAFFEAYSSRLLFGTDICLPRAHSEMAAQEVEQSAAEMAATYTRELDFYCTDRELVVAGRKLRGLDLAPRVQALFLRENARSYFGA